MSPLYYHLKSFTDVVSLTESFFIHGAPLTLSFYIQGAPVLVKCVDTACCTDIICPTASSLSNFFDRPAMDIQSMTIQVFQPVLSF